MEAQWAPNRSDSRGYNQFYLIYEVLASQPPFILSLLLLKLLFISHFPEVWSLVLPSALMKDIPHGFTINTPLIDRLLFKQMQLPSCSTHGLCERFLDIITNVWNSFHELLYVLVFNVTGQTHLNIFGGQDLMHTYEWFNYGLIWLLTSVLINFPTQVKTPLCTILIFEECPSNIEQFGLLRCYSGICH